MGFLYMRQVLHSGEVGQGKSFSGLKLLWQTARHLSLGRESLNLSERNFLRAKQYMWKVLQS